MDDASHPVQLFADLEAAILFNRPAAVRRAKESLADQGFEIGYTLSDPRKCSVSHAFVRVRDFAALFLAWDRGDEEATRKAVEKLRGRGVNVRLGQKTP